MATIYLARANTKLVCYCRCAHSLISSPSQMDCPWCGCGWLFTCITCGKAYAFARGVLVDPTLEELGRTHWQRCYHREPKKQELAEWVQWMRILLKNVESGHEYVYVDGYYIDVDAGPLQFEGWHAEHDLPWVPQVEALADPSVLDRTIGSREYWCEHAIGLPQSD
jgi:hypothetical protein